MVWTSLPPFAHTVMQKRAHVPVHASARTHAHATKDARARTHAHTRGVTIITIDNARNLLHCGLNRDLCV